NVLHEAAVGRPASKRELVALVARSALDVSRPTFYAMAIIIAALIPVFTLQRVEGRIFRPLALTYSFALTGALVFALTIVPALGALVLRTQEAQAGEPRFLGMMRHRYTALLQRLLRARFVVIGVALGALVVAGAVLTRVGTEFLPELDEGDVVIFVEMPPSIALETGQEILADVRRRLLEFPEVAGTLSEQGRPEDGTDNEGVNMSETFVRFKPRGEWRRGLDKDRLVEA